MPSETASFYTRNRDIFAPDVKQPGKKTRYLGLERRMEKRRRSRDRRVDVRFNLTKSDRRQLEGRREGDALPKFW